MATVPRAAQKQFTAAAIDQNGKPITTTFSWSTSGGVIDVNGLFTATAATGTFSVSATSGSATGQATVTVQ